MKKPAIKSKNLSVYLAGPFSYKKQIKKIAKDLEREGYTVTSSWLEQRRRTEFYLSPFRRKVSEIEEIENRALADLKDIRNSNVLVVIEKTFKEYYADEDNYHGSNRSGRSFEVGYAHAHGLPLVFYRTPANNLFEFVFGRFPVAEELLHEEEEWPELLRRLEKLSIEREGLLRRDKANKTK